MGDGFGGVSSLGPTPSPAASSSAHDSSIDIFSQSQGGGDDVLVSGVGGECEEVDVERWEEGEEGEGEGVDLLLEDLQASSNSEEESSEAGD